MGSIWDESLQVTVLRIIEDIGMAVVLNDFPDNFFDSMELGFGKLLCVFFFIVTIA